MCLKCELATFHPQQEIQHKYQINITKESIQNATVVKKKKKKKKEDMLSRTVCMKSLQSRLTANFQSSNAEENK